MKRQIKLLTSAVALGIIALTLSACGKSGANQVNEEKVSIIKDAQSSNQRIWYMAESDNLSNYELGKNSHINLILVTKNGKATVYNMPDKEITMRDIDDKSDEKIISMAKKEDKQYYNDTIKEYKKEVQDDIDSDKGVLEANTWNYSAERRKEKQELEFDIKARQSFLNKFPVVKYEKPSAKLLKAQVFTDNSGNDIVQENIIHQRIRMDSKASNVKLKYYPQGTVSYPENIRLTMTNGFRLMYDAPVKILNTMYVGYTNQTNDQNTDFLMTKTTNKKAKSDFDTLNTKNVSEGKD